MLTLFSKEESSLFYKNNKISYTPYISLLKTVILPVEAMVNHEKTGNHSCLIVDYCKRTDAVRIANFRYITSSDGWVSCKTLSSLYESSFTAGDNMINSDGQQWRYRIFELRKKYN